MHVEYNLFALIKDLEKQNFRAYSMSEIAKGADVHRHTIERIISNKTESVTLKTIAGLLRFFKTEGMPITISDLFVISKTKENTPHDLRPTD